MGFLLAPPSRHKFKKIKLTKGMTAYVSPEDFERVARYKWQASNSAIKGRKPKWYAQRKFKMPDGSRRTVKMHRFIMSPPSHMAVDHKDGNGLNNTRSNLEIVTHEENNTRSNVKKLTKR